MSIKMIVLSLIIGYAAGLFQTSFIYSKLRGEDIRQKGSGNAGTTNALRSYGKKVGALVLLGDLLKCVVAVLVARALFAGGDPAMGHLIGLFAGLGCVLGHNFPFYMGFKGGKGIACTLGVAVMLYWPLAIFGFVIFLTIVLTIHYVSLGSLVALSMTVVAAAALSLTGVVAMPVNGMGQAMVVYVLLIVLAFFQHRSNIKRLATHTERKTYLLHKPE
ncbi:MAG: glycerol-3-phosphate 1-O-acyltransferase PlsY [Lachnospiraceae bacterium]|nr:glycerol-3-phosphate 1-O-acyltransferase PlsY [Lachnospiraceae bacterium]